MAIKFTNNAQTTLAAGITNVATSLTVATSSGALFPAITSPDYTYVTIINANTPTVFEIVKVTARSGDVFTITRAQEGTTAQAWATGDKVELRLTAFMLAEALAERLSDSGDTLAGDLDFAGFKAIGSRLQSYKETVAAASSSTAYAADLATANIFNVSMTGNCTFTFTNPPISGIAFSFMLILKQDATGSRTATWPATVKWPNASAPTLTTTASKVDILNFITVDGGATYYGALSLANM